MLLIDSIEYGRGSITTMLYFNWLVFDTFAMFDDFSLASESYWSLLLKLNFKSFFLVSVPFDSNSGKNLCPLLFLLSISREVEKDLWTNYRVG